MRIGFFDSGLGGLTVLKEFKRNHPRNEFIYFGDNKNLPYGSKTKAELLDLSSNAIDFLLSKNVDIIIIACGTVSSNVYENLKAKYNIPIYDIISPTINYINNSSFKSIGLMATEATILSGRFAREIKRNLYQKACPLLVPFIEGIKDLNIYDILKSYLADMKGAEAIILGCTHYPILEKEIKSITDVKLINMGKVLSDNLSIEDSFASTELYFSDLNEKLENNIKNIIDFEYEVKEV